MSESVVEPTDGPEEVPAPVDLPSAMDNRAEQFS